MSDEQHQQIVSANPHHSEPAPGSIEHARLAKKRLHQDHGFDSVTPAKHRKKKGLSKEQLVAEKVPKLFYPDSALWRVLAFLGPLSTQVLCHAAKYSFEFQEASARSSSTVSQMFVFRGLAHMSTRTLAIFIRLARSKISQFRMNDFALQGSAAVLDGAALLWGGMFGSLKCKIEAGELLPLVFVRRSRYDETPMKVRLSECIGGQQTSEVSTHAKVLQTECAFQSLLQDRTTKRIWSLEGYLPTSLKAMDATTAENIKCAVLMDVDRVPNWKEFANCFPWVLQSTTVDRYAANFKAEKAMLTQRSDTDKSESSHWTKYTKSCDVHVIAQVHHKVMSILESDISGMLNTSLAQYGAGALNTMQDILRNIFDDACIIYGLPPGGHIERHRMAVLDLYLPLPTETPSEISSYDISVLVKRHILTSLLNGDIESDEIIHHCTFGCCTDIQHTIDKLKRFAVFALLGTKQPRFARNRWNNQEAAICWSGLFFGNVYSVQCNTLHLHYVLLHHFTFHTGRQLLYNFSLLKSTSANC